MLLTRVRRGTKSAKAAREVLTELGLAALKELGEPREVLRQTKKRMFEA